MKRFCADRMEDFIDNWIETISYIIVTNHLMFTSFQNLQMDDADSDFGL